MKISRLITSLIFISGTSLLSLAACGGDEGDDDGMGGEGSGGDTATGGTGSGGDTTGTGGDPSTGGSPTTGGTTGEGGMGGMGGAAASADCQTYCDDWETANCNAEVATDQEYATTAVCLGVCATFDDSGTAGDTSGDTLQCRVYHVNAATLGDADQHCGHAQRAPTALCVD